MPTGFKLNDGTDIEDLFEPYDGGATQVTGYKNSSGTDLGSLFMTYGDGIGEQPQPSTGFKLSNGSDIGTVFAALGDGVIPLVLDTPSITSDAHGESYVGVYFNAATGNVPIASFYAKVYVYTSGGSYLKTTIGNTNATYVRVSNLSEDTSYKFRVLMYATGDNGTTDVSSYSNYYTRTTDIAKSATATSFSITNARAALRAAGASSYEYHFNGDSTNGYGIVLNASFYAKTDIVGYSPYDYMAEVDGPNPWKSPETASIQVSHSGWSDSSKMYAYHWDRYSETSFADVNDARAWAENRSFSGRTLSLNLITDSGYHRKTLATASTGSVSTPSYPPI